MIPLRPFIEMILPKDGIVDEPDDFEDDDIDDMDAGHCYPDLVALAVVLMEISFVNPFSQLAAMGGIQLMETRSGRMTLTDVDLVLEKGGPEGGEEGWRSQIPEESPLLQAIDTCLRACDYFDSRDDVDWFPEADGLQISTYSLSLDALL